MAKESLYATLNGKKKKIAARAAEFSELYFSYNNFLLYFLQYFFFYLSISSPIFQTFCTIQIVTGFMLQVKVGCDEQ